MFSSLLVQISESARKISNVIQFVKIRKQTYGELTVCGRIEIKLII